MFETFLIRFQAKGMDVGVSSDIFNGIDYEESSSSEEEPAPNGKLVYLKAYSDVINTVNLSKLIISKEVLIFNNGPTVKFFCK